MIDYSNILMGKGGNEPGLDLYGALSGVRETILSLEKRQSIYAVGISPNGNIIVVGTKTGEIYWLSLEKTNLESYHYSAQHLTSGAPILSLCFVNVSTIAVADTAGRCLLWQFREDTQPTELCTDNRVIYSLFLLDSMHLAGLSLPGTLLIWDLSDRKLVKTLKIPGPPQELMALIKPVYWAVAESWVWPGQHGSIVLYKWKRNEFHTVCAHEDDVYVTLVCNDQLLTIGRDGSLKCWRTAHNAPIKSYETPRGIISGIAWDDGQIHMVLINDAGEAGIYSWDGDNLSLISRLPGRNYRVAVIPDIEQFKKTLLRQKMTQAGNIADLAKNRIKQRAWDELESLYKQLVEIGFVHVALALRGEEAAIRNDMVAQIIAYNELIQMIPHDRPESRSFLIRYAELLETVWQLKGAERIYAYLSKIEPSDESIKLKAQRLSEYAKIASRGMYVIEADTPLSLLARSSAILNEPFVGRYIVKSLEPPLNCLTHISADELIERYEGIKKTKASLSLPQAERMELWYLSKEKTEKMTTVIFRSDNPDSVNCLEYGIAFFDAGLQTVMKRITLFNTGNNEDGTSVEQHNQMLLERLRCIENNCPSNNGWLQMVDRSVTYAIRQIMTKSLATKFRESGGNYG